jgi:hypothetical protein
VGKSVNLKNQGEFMSRENEAHGDEDEIAAEARRCAEEFEAEHADDWKYSDERLGYEHE